MADKKIADLNGGVLVNPAMADKMLIETVAGNSRPTDFSRVRDLMDKQIDRYLVLLGGSKGGLRLMSAEFTPDLSSASVTVSAAFPAGSLILGVTTYVNAILTGALTSFDVGLTGNLSAFGNYLSTAATTSKVGVVSPIPILTPTDLILTANGGNGASNADKIRVVAYYLLWDTPAE